MSSDANIPQMEPTRILPVPVASSASQYLKDELIGVQECPSSVDLNKPLDDVEEATYKTPEGSLKKSVQKTSPRSVKVQVIPALLDR